MATIKLSLDKEALTNEFFEETRLLGIVTSVKDYRFCWSLNKMLDFNFRVNAEIEIQLIRKRRKYFFSVYEYHEPNNALCHYLYNNLNDGEYLLPEFKNLDFLWLMKDEPVSDNYFSEMVQLLKAVPGVQLVTELTNEKIKNKDHLIF